MPHKASILIVDDELEIRDALSRHFRLRGDDVVTANDVDAAEKALATRWFDVVVSDILMPGRSGTDLLSVLGEEYPMTHAIMITGYVTVENAMCCMRRGADTCIFKPLASFDELDEAVERALNDINRWKVKLAQLTGARASESPNG